MCGAEGCELCGHAGIAHTAVLPQVLLSHLWVWTQRLRPLCPHRVNLASTSSLMAAAVRIAARSKHRALLTW